VIVTHPQVPEDNLRLLRLLGAAFDRGEQAEVWCAKVSAALGELHGRVASLSREPVLYLIWRKPWMTVARETYIGATLACAGWDTVPATARARYPAVDDDGPEWREAARLLLSTEPFAFRQRDAAALAHAHARPAHLIDGEWTSWYGVRAAEGVRALGALRLELASAGRC
jgi:hypothetical protein